MLSQIWVVQIVEKNPDFSFLRYLEKYLSPRTHGGLGQLRTYGRGGYAPRKISKTKQARDKW